MGELSGDEEDGTSKQLPGNYWKVLYALSTRTPDEQYTTNQRGGELNMT
jgi:hypothetical protein